MHRLTLLDCACRLEASGALPCPVPSRLDEGQFRRRLLPAGRGGVSNWQGRDGR